MHLISVFRHVGEPCCGYAPCGFCLHCGREGRRHREEGASHWRTRNCWKGGMKILLNEYICFLWTCLTVCGCFLLCNTASNRNRFASTQTGANDLQTLADRLAQQSICASLSRRFPKVTIIGEEVCVFDAKQPNEEEGENWLMLCAFFGFRTYQLRRLVKISLKTANQRKSSRCRVHQSTERWKRRR